MHASLLTGSDCVYFRDVIRFQIHRLRMDELGFRAGSVRALCNLVRNLMLGKLSYNIKQSNFFYLLNAFKLHMAPFLKYTL